MLNYTPHAEVFTMVPSPENLPLKLELSCEITHKKKVGTAEISCKLRCNSAT